MEDLKSKSQKKREACALQALGVSLIALPAEKLAQLPLTDRLMNALLEAKKLTSHGAIRRQAQFIGKLMRAADHAAIQTAYESLQEKLGSGNRMVQAAESWRAQLLTEGEAAINAFIAENNITDIMQLHQLIKRAVNAVGKEKTQAERALFRYVRSHLL